jgi:hypothetical protein
MLQSSVSGLTLWQFADIKADDHDTANCGGCTVIPGTNPPDCSFVNTTVRTPVVGSP